MRNFRERIIHENQNMHNCGRLISAGVGMNALGEALRNSFLQEVLFRCDMDVGEIMQNCIPRYSRKFRYGDPHFVEIIRTLCICCYSSEYAVEKIIEISILYDNAV